MEPFDIDMAAFGKGDERAFTKVFNHFFGSLVWFSRQFVKDEQDAQDIVMKVFEYIWVKRLQFETYMKLKALLVIATKNRSLNFIRDRKARSIINKSVEDSFDIGYDSRLLDNLIKLETITLAISHLKKLSPNERLVFGLYYIKGLRWKEIEDATRFTHKNVGTYKSRAESKIRKEIQKSETR